MTRAWRRCGCGLALAGLLLVGSPLAAQHRAMSPQRIQARITTVQHKIDQASKVADVHQAQEITRAQEALARASKAANARNDRVAELFARQAEDRLTRVMSMAGRR